MVEMIASPMVDVPAFRAMLLRSLQDRSPIGKAEARGDGMVSVQLDDGFSMGRSASPDDREAPAVSPPTPIRMADFYAWQLATLEGAPAFNPLWPEPRRDAGLAAMADFLRRKGAR